MAKSYTSSQVMDAIASLQDATASGFSRVHARLDDTNRRVELLRHDMNRRFDKVDERFNEVDKRFNEVDKRFNEVDKRFDRVESRLDRLERGTGRRRGH